jgi:hypothetical protein
VVTGHVPEDPFLFAITEKPESSALFSELVNNTLSASFWREAFAAQGLHLSEDLAVVEIISGKEWKIIDGKPGPVTVQTYDESGEKMTEWPITGSKLEPVAFTIRFEEDGLIRYNVHLRQKGPFGSGRSAFADRYFEKLTSDQVKTGRLCGIFLIAKSVEEDYLTEADYSIQVEHLGDLWLNSKKLQLREKRTLKEHRGNFINSDDDLDAADLGKKLDDLVGANEGDPDPFVIQGTPLAGTTVIRLVSTTNKVFERAKLHVLYKFYQ